jgi:hypothetical protein
VLSGHITINNTCRPQASCAALCFSFDQNMPRAPHVAPVLGPQRENFGAPKQLTGKRQNPGGDKTGPRSGSEPPVRSDPHWSHSHAINHRLHSPRPHPYTATHTARDSNLGSGNHDMSRLSALAYPNDAPIHGLTDIPLRLLSTDIECGTPAPRSRPHTTHGNTHCSRLRPRQWQVATATCLDYLHPHT